MMNYRSAGLSLLAACALAGCGDSDVKEVKSWMAQVKKDTKVSVAPLSEPKNFIPYGYTEKDEIDPFNANKLLAELAKAAANSTSNKYKPDMDRRKEQLENFPLDTMRMVGLMQKAGVAYALIQIDRLVYQVHAGQRLGQNYGIITSVSEDAVNIKENVQDAGGDWIERMSKLELQDSKETKK
jgi:type IV pilus assembly protein PilP